MAMNTKTSVAAQPRQPAFRARGWKAHRQRQILEAAFDEFAANGYAAARLDGVAKRANIAKGTIYLYFKNKELLFQAVVRSLVHPAPEQLEPPAAADTRGSTETKIRELVSRQYAQFVRNERARELFRLVVAESRRFPELSRSYHRDAIEPELGALRQFVRTGMASGVFRKTTAGDFPQILLAPALVAAVGILLFGKRSAAELEAYEQAHVEFVSRVLLPAAVPETLRKKRASGPGEKS
jgi:AcrR family transcriptional regulator